MIITGMTAADVAVVSASMAGKCTDAMGSDMTVNSMVMSNVFSLCLV